MSIFKRRRVPESKGLSQQYFIMRGDQWEKLDLGNLKSNEDFFRNVWNVYRCVKLICDSVASLPIGLVQRDYSPDGDDVEIYPGGASVESQMLSFLVSRASTLQSAHDMKWVTTSHLLLHGDAYLWIPQYSQSRPGAPKRIMQVLPLNPDAVTFDRGDTEQPVKMFHYQDGNAVRHIDPADMCFIRLPDPSDPLDGMSPLSAARESAEAQELSALWNKKLIQNGAKTPFLIHFEDFLDDKQIQEAREDILKNWQGAKNAGKPHVVAGGGKVTVVPIGMAPSDMDWLASRKMNTREIASVFGIDPSLLGDGENKTYSNMQEARKALYMETVLPMAQRILDAMSMFFFWDKSRRVVSHQFRIKTDQVPALQQDMTELWTAINASWEMSVNEKRKAKGLGTLEGPEYDEIYIPAGYMRLADLAAGTGDDAMPPRLPDADDKEGEE